MVSVTVPGITLPLVGDDTQTVIGFMFGTYGTALSSTGAGDWQRVLGVVLWLLGLNLIIVTRGRTEDSEGGGDA